MSRYRFSSFEEFNMNRADLRAFILEVCPEKGDLLFLALQETVNNAFFRLRCQDSTEGVAVSVTQLDDRLCITVCCDGAGVDVTPEYGMDYPASAESRGLNIGRFVDEVSYSKLQYQMQHPARTRSKTEVM